MSTSINASLRKLTGCSVVVSDVDAYKEPGTATVQLLFSDGSRLRAEYWRLIIDGKERVSSFDDRQKYGLTAPINARRVLKKELQGKTVEAVRLDKETADLVFEFSGNLKLQVFGFTGYEMWEISISRGGGGYSNYAKKQFPFVPDDLG